MGWSFGKRAFGAVAGMMMFAGLASPASAAVVITANPSPVPVGSNVTFTVSDEIFDLIGILAFIGYDNTALQFLSAAPNPNFPGASDPDNTFVFSVSPDGLPDEAPGSPGSPDPIPDIIEPFAPAFGVITFGGDAGYTSTGSEAIFTATFKALKAGPTGIFAAGFYEQDLATSGVGVVPILGFGQVTVTGRVGAIPEPATWAMMILGFGLIGGVLRSQRGRRPAFA